MNVFYLMRIINRKLPPYIWAWIAKYKNHEEQTGSGTLVFENTYGQKFSKFDVEGQTSQESTTGKNMLNINATQADSVKLSSVSIVGSKVTLVKDTSSTAAGARYVLPINFETNTDYIITGKGKISNNTATGQCYIGIRKGSTSGQTIASVNLDISSTQEQNISTTFNSGDNTTMYFWFYVDSTNTAEEATLTRTVEYTDLMIRKASITDDTYEPYTGRNSSDQIHLIHSLLIIQ